MPHVLIRHKIKDFNKWKSVFDEHIDFRKAGGEKGGQVFHNIDNTSEVITVLKWDTIEKARKFIESVDLKKAMEKAGVDGKPEIYFLEEVELIKE